MSGITASALVQGHDIPNHGHQEMMEGTLGDSKCQPESEESTPLSCQEADAIIEDMESQEPIICECAEGDVSVWRQVQAVHENYVLGELQGLDVAFTVDSGASDTIVSPRVYQRIREDVCPRLFQGGRSIEGAGGESIRIWGQAAFDLQL